MPAVKRTAKPVAKPKPKTYRARLAVWLYPGESANWHFVTLPKDMSADIRERQKGPRRGWGSVRVTVTVGKTTWKTSIFPSKESASFLLPIKANVRKKEDFGRGDTVPFAITVG